MRMRSGGRKKGGVERGRRRGDGYSTKSGIQDKSPRDSDPNRSWRGMCLAVGDSVNPDSKAVYKKKTRNIDNVTVISKFQVDFSQWNCSGRLEARYAGAPNQFNVQHKHSRSYFRTKAAEWALPALQPMLACLRGSRLEPFTELFRLEPFTELFWLQPLSCCKCTVNLVASCRPTACAGIL